MKHRERYLLLVECGCVNYEVFDIGSGRTEMLEAKILEKIRRREPFAIHYVDDPELFAIELRKEIKAKKP